MIKYADRIIKICNILCAILMLAVLLCQFLSFWYHIDGKFLTVEEAQSVREWGQMFGIGDKITADSLDTLSIADAVWFPGRYYGAPFPEGHIWVLITGALGLVFCLKNNERTWTSIFPVSCCFFGIVTYSWCCVNSVAGMGWQIHMVILIALLIPALILSIYNIRRIKEFLQRNNIKIDVKMNKNYPLWKLGWNA